MKIKLFIPILILVLTVAHKQAMAQSKVWQWAIGAGRYGDDYAKSICTDASGNVYVTGSFDSDSINFGGITLYYAGGLFGDIFLAKYDASGNVLWAKHAGGGAIDEGSSISTDDSGNVYLIGSFVSSFITFGTDTLTRSGSADMFLVKYDAWGDVLWAKSAGGTSRDYGTSVSADASGNIYITGNFESDSITFGTTTLTNAGNAGTLDFFLAKIEGSGRFLWVKNVGGTDSDLGNSVSADDSGNVFVTGAFGSKSITFGTTTLTNAGSGGSAVFLAKYDGSGKVLWAKSAGGTSKDYGYDKGSSVSTDATGNVYVTGSFFSPSITFGTTTLPSDGTYDIFLVKFNESGNVLWAKKAGGTNYDYGTSVSTDNSGNVYVTGYFSSKSISIGTTALTNTGSTDIFLVKYDSSGNVLWAKSAGGTDSDVGSSVSADVLGNVYMAGTFSSKTMTFGTNTVYNSFRDDIFLAKLGICSNSSSLKNATACGSFIWNGKTYTTSGTYIDTTANAAGCDSIMTLNLKILTPPTVTLVLNPDTLCIYTGAYSLDGGSPIGGTYSGPGVSNGDFDPYAAGVGLHTITYTYDDVHGCSDSATAQIFVDRCMSIETESGFQKFALYPNPFSVQAVLESEYLLQNATLIVKNYLGQTVKQIKGINGHNVVFSRDNLASGLYFVHLTQNNNVIATQKILITD